MSEDTEIGGVTWHSSEEDGGPDVGISVYIGPDDRLWCGEVTRKAFDENNGGAHFEGDGGWFILRYQGDETKLIAKCADALEAREFVEQIAAWISAGRRPVLPHREALKGTDTRVILEQTLALTSTEQYRVAFQIAENIGHTISIRRGMPSVNEYVADYEYRGDQDYVPNEGERAMIEDAIEGYLFALQSAADTVGQQDALVKALENIAAMDPKGIRADDLGRAARIASAALKGKDAQ